MPFSAPLSSALLLALVMSSHLVTTDAKASVVKRSDDVTTAALQTLIQQQSNVIQTLQAEVAAMKAGQTQTEGRVALVEGRVGSLQANVSSIASRHQKQVGFSAYISTDANVNIGDSAPVVFDRVITNLGSSYDSSSGVFTAPYSGVYSLHFSMLNDAAATAGSLGVAIHLPNGALCEAMVVREYDHSSCSGVARLAKGDHVIVRRIWGFNHLHGNVYTTFSGFLVFLDEE